MRLRYGERRGDGLRVRLRGIEHPIAAVVFLGGFDVELGDGRGDRAVLLDLDKSGQPAKGEERDKRADRQL